MKLDEKGQSTILLAVFLGIMVALIGADLSGRLREASRLEYNLRQRNNTWQYSIQMAQIVGRAYELGRDYGTQCQASPCTLTFSSSAGPTTAQFNRVSITPSSSSGTINFLFPPIPSTTSGTTTQNPLCVDNYCIALIQGTAQPDITALNDRQFHDSIDSNDSFQPILPSRSFAALFPFEANAEAGSASPLPAPYLSPLPSVTPTNQVDVSKCNPATGVTLSSGCVVCSDGGTAPNADCVVIRICTNGTSNCPNITNPTTQQPNYILPRFAFVKAPF